MQAKIKFASIVLTKSQLERSWWQNAVFGAVTSPKILKLCVHAAQNLKEVEPESHALPNTKEQSSVVGLSQVDLQAQINLRGKVDIKALKPNSAPPPANSQAGDSSNASANTDASTAAESQPDSPTENKPTEDDVK